MAENKERFKRYIMSLSYKERRARELFKYKERIQELESMDSDELDFEYVSLKSAYEHKKSVLVLLIISIALALLMNVWKYFFSFIQESIQYGSTIVGNGIEVVEVSFTIAFILTLFTTFVIAFLLIAYMNELRQIQRELMIVEIVRNRLLVK